MYYNIFMSKRFRDPIHGFIEVSDDELKIIDTIEFQRMRNIKQLATTYLIYHGAEHSRFGHSLGMMHLVTRAFNSALDNYKKQNKKDLFNNDTRQVYLQILRLIALLHDIGHAPFSHACEDAFEKGIVHEDFTREIILNTGIRELINNIGEKYKEEYKNCETIITADLLWLIYGEKDEIAVKSLDYKFQDFKFLKCFTNSDVDCDKMDYLLWRCSLLQIIQGDIFEVSFDICGVDRVGIDKVVFLSSDLKINEVTTLCDNGEYSVRIGSERTRMFPAGFAFYDLTIIFIDGQKLRRNGTR